MMRPTARGALAGLVVFAVVTIATIAVTTAVAGGRVAEDLEPLDPAAAAVAQGGSDRAGTLRTELTFQVEGGTASAVLLEPGGGAEVGVVIVTGAGGADRSSHLALAEQFAAHGVAALTYDKRSEGYGALHRDFALLADDALSAAAALRSATGIERVGAWGISEGAWVVTDAAARPGSPLAFAVLAAAPVVSPGEQAAWLVDSRLRSAPRPVRLAAATVVAQGRHLLDYLDFDSGPRLAVIDVPVMAIWGAEDDVVPVNEAYRRLRDGLDGALLAQVLPGLGHDLRADTAAWVPAVAEWMSEPHGAGLTGVEPAADLGVAAVPRLAWHADPRLHLTAALLAALTTAVAVARGTRTHIERNAR